MLLFGLQITVKELTTPLKQFRLLALALILNVVLIPVIGFVLAFFFLANIGIAIGYLLIVIPAGAPIAPRFVQIADADVKHSVSLIFVLALASMIMVPLSVLLLLPSESLIDPLPIFLNLLVYQLLPLILGIVIYTKWETLSKKGLSIIRPISNLSLILLMIISLAIYGPLMITAFGELIVIISLLTIGASLLLGYLLGGSKSETREALMFTSSQRNAAIAFLLFSTFFVHLADAALSLIIYTLLQTFIVFGVAIYFGRRRSLKKLSATESPYKEPVPETENSE